MDWIYSALDEFASLICIVSLETNTAFNCASFGLDLSRISGPKVRQVGLGLGLTSRLVDWMGLNIRPNNSTE